MVLNLLPKESNKLDIYWQLIQPPSYCFESSDKTESGLRLIQASNMFDDNWIRHQEKSNKLNLA